MLWRSYSYPKSLNVGEHQEGFPWRALQQYRNNIELFFIYNFGALYIYEILHKHYQLFFHFSFKNKYKINFEIEIVPSHWSRRARDVHAHNFTCKAVSHVISETLQCFTRRQKRRRGLLLKHKGSRSHFGFVCLLRFFYLCSRAPLGFVINKCISCVHTLYIKMHNYLDNLVPWFPIKSSNYITNYHIYIGVCINLSFSRL